MVVEYNAIVDADILSNLSEEDIERSRKEVKFLPGRLDSTYTSTSSCGSIICVGGITTVTLLKIVGGSSVIANHTPHACGRHGGLLLAN